jgi:hypothetical protein
MPQADILSAYGVDAARYDSFKVNLFLIYTEKNK